MGYPENEAGQEELPWMMNAQPEPQDNICEGCGKEITWATGKNGKKWPPEAIIDYSKSHFGRCLCPDCQKKQPNANNTRR